MPAPARGPSVITHDGFPTACRAGSRSGAIHQKEAAMFKTIVVGVDGREGGRDAISLASRLAMVAGGELVAVRVLPFDYYVSRAGSPPYASLAEHDATRELENELSAAGVTARIRVMGDASPARALHRVAEEEKADVIVVGSTRHGRVGRVLAGDDAVGTVHASPVPVAVAPHGLAAEEWKPVQRIGVGYDARPEARQAFELALGLARDCGASLEVRSVLATQASVVDFTSYDEDWIERAKEHAVAELDAILDGVDVEASGEVVPGTAVEQLVELSEGVDLLVVGSRAWGPVRRIVLGSTAAALTRDAHCPLLVLPRGVATGEPGEREPERAASA
jgi:nucleotide-binding universal stress UspA family protein